MRHEAHARLQPHAHARAARAQKMHKKIAGKVVNKLNMFRFVIRAGTILYTNYLPIFS
jgi:hypothetical protein